MRPCVGSRGYVMNMQRCVIKVIQMKTNLLSPLLSDKSGRWMGQTHRHGVGKSRGYDCLFLIEARIYIPFLSSMVKRGMESQLKRLVFRYCARVIDQTFSVFIIFFFQVRSRLYVGKLIFDTLFFIFLWSMTLLFLFAPLIIWMMQHLLVFHFLGREKQLADKVAELVEEKCKILEKLSLCKKEVTAYLLLLDVL